MKVHHVTPSQTRSVFWIYCRWLYPAMTKHRITTEWKDVTCKRCLKKRKGKR